MQHIEQMAERLMESRDGCRIALRGVRNRPFATSGFRHLSSATGFTLVELIVVLVIIALTVAVVVPRVGSNWKKIEDSAFLQEFTETTKKDPAFCHELRTSGRIQA